VIHWRQSATKTAGYRWRGFKLIRTPAEDESDGKDAIADELAGVEAGF